MQKPFQLTGVFLQTINNLSGMPWSPARLYASNSGMYSSGQHQDHTVRGRTKAQSCQSHFLGPSLLRKTFPPADEMELSCKSTTLLTTLEGHEQFWCLLSIVFLLISSLCCLSEWSHALSPTSHIRRITKNHSPSHLRKRGGMLWGAQSCCNQRGASAGVQDPLWPWQH